jgi:hypothetical protein
VILNTQSVTSRQAKFKVKLGEQENEFTVSQIRPGYAASFSVYVPDVQAKECTVRKVPVQGIHLELLQRVSASK